LFSDRDILIGKVLAPHGIAGQVRVFPYSDYPERVVYLNDVILQVDKEKRKMTVEKATRHGHNWLLKFSEVESREEAEKLRDGLVFITREERMPLPEGSYYHDQLIGLDIYTEEGQYLGKLSNVITRGGHDQLIIKLDDRAGKETMIPAVKEFIRQVDLEEGKAVVNLPEGLLDL